jgi:RimJ/RimL family protein N-acetyltransferase
MRDEITLEKVNVHDTLRADAISRWFQSDEDGRRLMDFYARSAEWYALFGDDRYGEVIILNGKPIGFVDIEVVHGSEAHIAYYVAPASRGKGVGRRALTLLERDFLRRGKIKSVHAFVERANVRSAALLRGLGYKEESEDDKMIHFWKRLSPRPLP